MPSAPAAACCRPTALTSPSPSQPAQRPALQRLAIGKIRLYKVVNAASLPAAINYPALLARRHVHWREEMADEGRDSSTAASAPWPTPSTGSLSRWTCLALGFNTVGKDMLEWGLQPGL